MYLFLLNKYARFVVWVVVHHPIYAPSTNYPGVANGSKLGWIWKDHIRQEQVHKWGLRSTWRKLCFLMFSTDNQYLKVEKRLWWIRLIWWSIFKVKRLQWNRRWFHLRGWRTQQLLQDLKCLFSPTKWGCGGVKKTVFVKSSLPNIIGRAYELWQKWYLRTQGG